jgi:hypothetical protein
MLDSIERLEPTLLLKHNGRAAGFLSFAAEEILTGGTVIEAQQVMMRMTESHPIIAVGDPKCICEQTGKHAGASYVSKMVGIFCAHQARFRESVVVIDLWQSSPEAALQQLSAWFAASTTGVSKLDVGGAAANASSIAVAHELQHTLNVNCDLFAHRSN